VEQLKKQKDENSKTNVVWWLFATGGVALQSHI